MVKFRRLGISDKEQLFNLINTVEEKLSDETWWLPIKDEAANHFFDTTWTVFWGAFESEKLIAACGLFLNEFEYSESASLLDLEFSSVAEIGRCMVSPDYRGQNLMFRINNYLLKEAKERKRTKIIATAHPDNIASNESLRKLGMQTKKRVIKFEKFLRNVYFLDIADKIVN